MRGFNIELNRSEIMWLKVKCMDCGLTYEVHGWELLHFYKLECPYCKYGIQNPDKLSKE